MGGVTLIEARAMRRRSRSRKRTFWLYELGISGSALDWPYPTQHVIPSECAGASASPGRGSFSSDVGAGRARRRLARARTTQEQRRQQRPAHLGSGSRTCTLTSSGLAPWQSHNFMALRYASRRASTSIAAASSGATRRSAGRGRIRGTARVSAAARPRRSTGSHLRPGDRSPPRTRTCA